MIVNDSFLYVCEYGEINELNYLGFNVLSKYESLQVFSKSFNRPCNHSTNECRLTFTSTLFQLANIKLKEKNEA